MGEDSMSGMSHQAERLSGKGGKSERGSHAALMTSNGVGAVATILFRGNGKLLDASAVDAAGVHTSTAATGFRPRNGLPMEQQEINRILFGKWGNDPGEDVVVCRISDEEYEIHCHGGRMAASRILDDLKSFGCETVMWQESLVGYVGAWERDFNHALNGVATEAGLFTLLQQREAWKHLREEVRNAGDDVSRIGKLLQEVLDREAAARHLREPYLLVLLGRPNVGKSSLLNALLGFQRAIVHAEPGTTRDVLQGETAIAGFPVRLIDTAGVRETTDEIEGEGIARTKRSVEEADGVLLVLDQSLPLCDEDRDLLHRYPEAIRVLNKGDLPRQIGHEIEGITLSAKSGDGLETLLSEIAERFFVSVPETAPVPFTSRLRAYLNELLNVPEEKRDLAWLTECEELWKGMS